MLHKFTYTNIFEGSLEAKLPTIWRDGNGTARKKLGRGESRKGEDDSQEETCTRREKMRDGKDQRWRKSEERRCRCAKR